MTELKNTGRILQAMASRLFIVEDAKP